MKFTRAFAGILFAIPAFGQYAGPAILSRGEAPAAMNTPGIAFRPYISAAGTYDTGLAGVGVDAQGELGNVASAGVQLTAGISGVHSWKHTKLGLDYMGSLSHRAATTYYDSSNQSFMLGITHELSRNLVFTLRENLGMFSRSNGLLSLPQTVPFDPSTTYIPTTDFFDNRTMYLSTQAAMTVQRSTRLSFNLGVESFLNRRRSTSLYGVTGAGANGDVQYRLTARSTAGAAYSYTKYKFTGVFSGTDIHSVVGTYAIRLTRTLELSAYGGILRSETKFIQQVNVDPAIAALIGRFVGGVIVHRIDYMPNISGRFSKTFRHGVAYITGGHTATPGNGLFLTSRATTVGSGYSYTGLRRWSFNAQAGYNRSTSLGNVIGDYGSKSANLSLARRIGGSMNLIANVSARQYNSADFSKYHRLVYTAQFGIGFTPGDIPLRIW